MLCKSSQYRLSLCMCGVIYKIHTCSLNFKQTKVWSMESCNTTDPLKKLQLYVVIEAVFAVISSLACLATIILVVAVRAYRSYIHRLTLYLAITSFCFAVSLGLSVAPVNTDSYPISLRSGWNDTCIAFGFLIQYFGYSSALSTLWICINVFALSVFNVKAGRCGCEVIGYLIIFFVPCLVFWIPVVSNSFGQTSVWCWIRCSLQRQESTAGQFQLAATLGPILVLYLISLMMTFVVVMRFLVELKRGHVKAAHKAALKEVLPLLIYPGTYCVVFGVAAFTPLYVSYAYRNVSISVFRSIVQAIRLLLPLSFILHPSIRLKLCTMLRGKPPPYRTKDKWQGYEPSVMDTTTMADTPVELVTAYKPLSMTPE